MSTEVVPDQVDPVRLCPIPHRGRPPVTEGRLCRGHEHALDAALDALPELYTHVYLALGDRSAGAEKVTLSRTPPIGIRGDLHDLMVDVVRVVTCWEEVVRDVAHLTDPPARTRDGWALSTACRTLRAWLSVLLALGPTAVNRVTPDGQDYETDINGLGAAREILDLVHRCRSALRRTELVHHLPAACPNIDCGQPALVRRDGADHVECEACGRTYDQDDYQRLTRILAAEAQETAC